MIIGIHPDNLWGSSFSEKWEQFLTARGVEIRKLDLLAHDALEQARSCDGIMWRWFHIQQDKQSARNILQTIETGLNIPVFPSINTSWHFDDKISQDYLLRAVDAPLPASWIFWDQQSAEQWAKNAPYPVVFKLSVGAGASNVLKVDSREQALQLIRRMFTEGVFPMTMNEYGSGLLPKTFRELRAKLRRPLDAARYLLTGTYPRLPHFWWKPEFGYAYFQEFLPGNDCDIRVTVIGRRAFAFRRLNRPGDFRASGSGLLDYAPEQIDPACLQLAFDISKKAGFQTMAYDFLYRQGQPVICEISYSFVDTAVYACPGHWDDRLVWNAGQMWPEEAQVDDFIAEVLRHKGAAA